MSKHNSALALIRDAAWCTCALIAVSALQAQAPLTEVVLHSFVVVFPMGANPDGGLLRSPNGNFFGTTFEGGAFDAGLVYKLDPNGRETVLYNFTGGADGGNPHTPLAFDQQGNLYGTTDYVVYKLDQTGHETVLHTFSSGLFGGVLAGGLVLDPAGNIYGVTSTGGTTNYGIVFELDPTGDETILHNFTGPDGGGPNGSLVRDASGNLFGTTAFGGPGLGTVFKLDPSGNQTILYSFTDGVDGGEPLSGVVLDPSGNLYGTTVSGGAGSINGVIYKVSPLGQETVLHSFTEEESGTSGVARDAAGNLYGTLFGSEEVFKLGAKGDFALLYHFPGGEAGEYPQTGLIVDPAGNLYGTTNGGGASGEGVVYELDPVGQETILASFPQGSSGGSNSEAGVVLDSAGNVYGTTSNGGKSPYGGLVYQIDTSGKETVLYRFPGGPVETDLQPGLLRDPAGNLYGVTYNAGSYPGFVFKVAENGEVTVLHQFSYPPGTDGYDPSSSLVLDAAGNLYGTTSQGGEFGSGTVYKIGPSGKESVLFSFSQPDDAPTGCVALDAAGNIYGTTSYGGASYAGTVYKLEPNGQETDLYTFTGGADGGNPQAGVTIDAAGNLYGTAYAGGIRSPNSVGYGVVYKVDPSGNQTVVHSFNGGSGGSNPEAGVILDRAGNLYGTTSAGGDSGGCLYSREFSPGCGVVFRVDPSGQESVLYSFTGGADGAHPYSRLTADPQGNLYGTTYQGGKYGGGVVYKLLAPSDPN